MQVPFRYIFVFVVDDVGYLLLYGRGRGTRCLETIPRPPELCVSLSGGDRMMFC